MQKTSTQRAELSTRPVVDVVTGIPQNGRVAET